MVTFPLHFTVEAEGKSGIAALWTARSAHLPPISCGIPPEFGGTGQGYSPEDLFALSILNCLIATFKVYCEKSNLSFSEIKGKAVVSMSKHPSEKSFWLSDIDFTLEVRGASNIEKVKALLDRAVQDCAVSNSIKSAKTFHLHVY